MSLTKAKNKLKKIFDDSFNYKTKFKKPGEAWVLLVDGRRTSTRSGKNLWAQKTHVKLALTNHFEYYSLSLTERPPNMTYEERREFKEKVLNEWIEEHVEIIRYEEWLERNTL